MSIIDSLILANIALLSIAIDRNLYGSRFFQIVIGILVLLPALGLFSFLVYILFRKPLKVAYIPIKQKIAQVKFRLCCCSGDKNDGASDEEQGNTDEEILNLLHDY